MNKMNRVEFNKKLTRDFKFYSKNEKIQFINNIKNNIKDFNINENLQKLFILFYNDYISFEYIFSNMSENLGELEELYLTVKNLNIDDKTIDIYELFSNPIYINIKDKRSFLCNGENEDEDDAQTNWKLFLKNIGATEDLIKILGIESYKNVFFTIKPENGVIKIKKPLNYDTKFPLYSALVNFSKDNCSEKNLDILSTFYGIEKEKWNLLRKIVLKLVEFVSGTIYY